MTDSARPNQVVFARLLDGGCIARVHADATVDLRWPDGSILPSPDPLPHLASAIQYWRSCALDSESYAETIISGSPATASNTDFEEVPML